jgi:hypothetical protein
MRWDDYDKRLKRLYNAIATAFSETVSDATSQKAEKEAMDLMEELTNELKQEGK